jgi:superfamily I DNA/RNA helicase/mRNA-degrading endonuclease RelE of RelBE toxin-antitoxin system
MSNVPPLSYLLSDDFVGEFEALPKDIQKRAQKTIEFLSQDRHHPSLKAHRLRSNSKVWEAYVTDRHRIIYEIEDGQIKLWHVGDHEIVDSVHRRTFSPHTGFRRILKEDAPAPDQPATAPLWSFDELQPAQASENPFANLPAAHLRILGVPSHLVKAVREAKNFEALEQLPGLPAHSLQWLTELATNPTDPFDPARLIYRTTLDKLEGYCEGKIKRLMLNLIPEQQRFVEMDFPGAALLRGCAGSGKTTVAIYRAIRYAEQGKRVLFVTYNKTLAQAVRDLIEELIGPPSPELTVTHIDAFLMEIMKRRGKHFNIVKDSSEFDSRATLQEGIAAVRRTMTSAALDYDVRFFQDEFKMIKGNGLTTFDLYRTFARIGRGKALPESTRRAIWQVYEHYQAALRQRGLYEWADFEQAAFESLAAQPYEAPFDCAVIDEAQDMTAVQLRAIGMLVKPNATGKKSVFLVGDSAQTLYARGFAWQASGFQVQGYSFGIRRNFRSTREIAAAAAALYQHNTLRKDHEGQIDPVVCQRSGIPPIVLQCDTTDRERRAIGKKILDLVEDQMFRLSDFAVLCPTKKLCEDIKKDLTAQDIPCAIHTDQHFNILAEQVKILTIHSAKGLEFPIVFIYGLHNGTLPYNHRENDPEERQLRREDDRALLYVGMTRAAEALYLVTSTQNPSDFLAEFAEHVNLEPFNGA